MGKISTAKVAEMLHIREQTIRNSLCEKGHYMGLRPTKMPNRMLLWDLQAVLDLTTGASQDAKPKLARQPLTERQISDCFPPGDGMNFYPGGASISPKWIVEFVRRIESAHGITKVCPACGSEDVSIISQTENGEIVCAADYCQVCHHQWNVG